MSRYDPTSLPADLGVVRLFRNLHSPPPGAFTLMQRTRAGWRKAAVVRQVVLRNVTFHVNQTTRTRVRTHRKKEVHAYVRGEVAYDAPTTEMPYTGWIEATYNPYLFDSFVLAHNFQPLPRAAGALALARSVGGRPEVKVWVRLYPQDEHLVDRPRLEPSDADKALMGLVIAEGKAKAEARQAARKAREDVRAARRSSGRTRKNPKAATYVGQRIVVPLDLTYING